MAAKKSKTQSMELPLSRSQEKRIAIQSEGKRLEDIGNVVVHEGEPPDGNPYKGQELLGQRRALALKAFKHGTQPKEHTYWYAPASGGARRITAAEIDWDRSGL